MTTTATRKIVKIDEDKCNGCGLCVPSCAEGAIRIENGKARLLADNLCDGLGNCLGHCPMDAITIEERPAEEFDEAAVARHHRDSVPASGAACTGRLAAGLGGLSGGGGGCPGSTARKLHPQPAAPSPGGSRQGGSASRLGQWPVQLALVPVSGEMWQDADVLVAADCVALAMGDFHDVLLAGKTLAIACPKLDDVGPYVAKLAAIFSSNRLRSVTVAHMEVPCCTGIVHVVQEAMRRSGVQIPLRDVTVGVDGAIRRIQ
ncbi:MAG: ferredoxin [Planctomycetes bacterium ADurb.Bin126]|nr:MAG: ferredoxin [Planctomycetes bacterium ADurb.Bin126]HOD82586.1 4Fe-4S binding protein [Phycisphaerae bacterium]HQL75009.1 4Fe-4S binding protein [Phycisphaerae bacterium]